MMKSSTKRILALLLAVVMIAALAGCGGTPAAPADPGAPSEPAPAPAPVKPEEKEPEPVVVDPSKYTDYSAGFPDGTTIDIPIYDRAFDGWNVTDNYYTKWMKEQMKSKYNIDVNFVAIGRWSEIQDFTNLIVAKKSPSIIYHYDTPAAVSYWTQDVLQEIDYAEVAYYAPTYWNWMGDTCQRYGVINGKNAFLFAERQSMDYQWVVFVRKDWVKEAGYDAIPTTAEEMNECVLKIQANHPDLKPDLGGTLLTNSFQINLGYISKDTPDTDLIKYLDLGVAAFTWDLTYKWLENENYRYNNGIIRGNFYEREADTERDIGEFINGKTITYGMYANASQITDLFDKFKATTGLEPADALAIMPNQPAKGGNPGWYKNAPYGLIHGISNQITDVQRAAVYTFFEFLSQPDNLRYLEYGTEGKTYTVADGIITKVDGYTGEDALSPNGNKDMYGLVQEVLVNGSTPEETVDAAKKIYTPAGFEWIIEDSYKNFKEREPFGIVYPAFTKATDARAEYAADLLELWKEAYVDCVTCKPEELKAKYDKWCEEYLDAGYSEILSEREALIASGDYIFSRNS